jgi:antitoxin VapB
VYTIIGMALNIKHEEVERLANEVAELAGESKTEAVRRALVERRARLRSRVSPAASRERFRRYLKDEVWPRVPPDQLGRRSTQEEEDAILGYGPEGV